MALLVLGDFLYEYEKIQEDIEKIAEWIHRNKFQVILNLEGPITNDESHKIKKRGPNLKQKSTIIEVLKKLQVIGVCLSNNHIMDYGKIGLEDTIRFLDANNIAHVGAGRNIEEACKPMRITENGKIINIFNYGWNVEETIYANKNEAGCAPRQEEIILSNILLNKDEKNIAIMHWGFEYNKYPMPYDISLAHKMVDAGYDLIIGHHPHVIQPMEQYREKEIFYSIGNFYMSSRRKEYYDLFNMPNEGKIICIDSVLKTSVFSVKSNINETKLVQNADELINISDIDYLTKKYKVVYKQNKNNFTPMLTENRILNNIKLLVLNIFYAVYKKLKRFRKYSIIDLPVKILKEICR